MYRISKTPTVFTTRRTINQTGSFCFEAFQRATPFQGSVQRSNNINQNVLFEKNISIYKDYIKFYKDRKGLK